MTFKVDPGSVSRYGELLMRAAEDTRAGNEHLTKFGHAEDADGGIYKYFFHWHQQSVALVAGTLEHVACVGEGGKIGLVAAATYYRSTDQDAARRLDNTLPLAPCLTGLNLEEKVDRLVGPPPPFADWRHPRERLTEPAVPEPGGVIDRVGEILEPLSVSGVVLFTLRQLFGYDPVEALVCQVRGNWEKLYECGVVFHQLADLSGDVAINIDQGARELDAVWDGNAGDAAVQYFKRLADSIDKLAPPLDKLGDAHQQVATSTWEAAETLKGLISTMIDDTVVVSVMVSAGAALIETGLGPLICYGGAAFEIAEIYEIYVTCTKKLHLLYNTALLLTGLITGAIAEIEGLPKMDVIADTYHHPAAAR
jgi:hypothetical protein